MLAFREHMDEEPADELSRFQRHGFVPTGAFDTVILDAEGDATPIHTDQSAIGNRHAVGISRQICQDSLWPGEGLLGIDDPVDFAQRLEDIVECNRAGKAA